jgi:hypothetical protein
VRKNRKRTIRNIGPVSRFDDGKADFVGRLKRSFKDGNPIIAGLEDLLENTREARVFTLRFDRDSLKNSFSAPKNIGYFLLDSLYDGLGIYDVLNNHKSRRNITFDLNGNAKLLVFGRTLFPDSKLGTFEDKDRYIFDVTKSDSNYRFHTLKLSPIPPSYRSLTHPLAQPLTQTIHSPSHSPKPFTRPATHPNHSLAQPLTQTSHSPKPTTHSVYAQPPLVRQLHT